MYYAKFTMSVSTTERESSVEFDIVAAAEQALDLYCSQETGERSDFPEHAMRSRDLATAFAGGLMPKECIAVSTLHDIADRLHNKESSKNTPERERASREALLKFFTDPRLGSTEGEYMLCLLADMVVVEKHSGVHRIEMAKQARNSDNNGNGPPSEVVEMISEQYQGSVPAEVWGRIEPLLDFDSMRRFMKEVNLESLIIKACELVDNMQNPSSVRESAWLQDVLEAESYYAPTMEVLGLDGLASMLRGEAHILRLMGQGEQAVIDSAREMYTAIEKVGIRNVVANILSGEAAIDPAVGELAVGQGDHPVHVGEFVVETGGDTMSGNYRLKTVGSLANKMSGKYNGEAPMDVLGLTVISDDEKSSANDFVHFIMNRLPDFKDQKAKGKQSSMFISGTAEYICTIKQVMREKGFDESRCQFREDEADFIEVRGYKNYEVSKVTFIVEQDGVKIPTEVQFVTKAERKRARQGEVSHLIYKYLNQLPKLPGEEGLSELSREEKLDLERRRALRNRPIIEAGKETQSDCYDRKENMSPDDLQVNRRSLPRGEALAWDMAA